MKRTISFMTGKGSVNHNSRKFHAKNTDLKRSHWNVEYCNQDIRKYTMNYLMRHLNDIIPGRPEKTERLKIIMRRSALKAGKAIP